ncbi:MAG: DNA-binding protein [Aliarcobacter sp.]|nr:DNA-binding protein [Aliarcobacter sp.]
MRKEEVNSFQTKKMYRAKEVAQLLGIGLSTVWLFAKQGKLTPKKLSEKVTVFSIDEINKNFGLEVVA